MTDKVIFINSFLKSRDGRADSPTKVADPKRANPLADANQLSLAIDPLLSAWIFPLDELHGAVFISKLEDLRPACVIDFRYFQHFDLKGTGANAPRQALKRLDPIYISREIPAETFTPSTNAENALSKNCTEALKLLRQAQKTIQGPIFVLVHHKREAFLVSGVLQDRLNEIGGGWQVDLVLEADAIAL